MRCRNAAPRYRLCHDGSPACKQLGRRTDDEGDLASRNKSSDGNYYTVAIANASPISPEFIDERNTLSGCLSASSSSMSGCSTMFQ